MDTPTTTPSTLTHAPLASWAGKKTTQLRKKACCFCQQPFPQFGNNPAPLMDCTLYSCCDHCNLFKVLPARRAARRQRA